VYYIINVGGISNPLRYHYSNPAYKKIHDINSLLFVE
jgi:hypothetical protein